MKYLLTFLLLSLMALQACHKKETEHVIFPYNKHYDVYYDKNRDSIHSFAIFNNGYGSFSLDKDESVTMNNEPVSYVEGSTYHWVTTGKKDLVFILTSHSGTYSSTVKADDIKAYDIDIPDTVSMANWKTIKIKGPAYVSPEFIHIDITFSNNTDNFTSVPPASDAASLGSNFFNNASTGKTLIDLTWINNNIVTLQSTYPSGSDDIRITTHTRKEVWLKP